MARASHIPLSSAFPARPLVRSLSGAGRAFARRISRLAPLALALFAFAGCAPKSTVPLVYPTPPVMLDETCAAAVTVVPFVDARQNPMLIGKKSDGDPFIADIPASEWVATGTYEELRSRNCQAIYRTKTPAEVSGWALGGEIEDIQLTQSDPSQYSGKMAVRFTLWKDGAPTFHYRQTVQMERTVFPSSSVPREFMTEMLRDLLGLAAPKVLEQVK